MQHPGDEQVAVPPRPTSRWDWKRSVVVVALLLCGVGVVNVLLHGRASAAADAESAARALRALLQEESNLQWRVLAEEGPALHVAREMGDLRRQEYDARDELSPALGDETATRLVNAMNGYHDAIDRELGLLAVGRLSDALAYERQETVPLFERTDRILVTVADRSAADAGRARAQATTMLVVALAGVLVLTALLFRRAQAAHQAAAAAIAARLDQEREVSASLERARAMVHHQATHDALTGLPNRLGLREGLRELAGASGSMLCVVFVDLDNFKSVNDRWGHEEGDRVLCVIADTLRDAVRADELAARVGGDEFTVVASVPSPQDGDRLAERIRGRVLATCAEEGAGTGLGASVGAAVGPAAEVRALLDAADRAMYREKQEHRAEAIGR